LAITIPFSRSDQAHADEGIDAELTAGKGKSPNLWCPATPSQVVHQGYAQ
jgi:hypothetical protein